MTAKELFLEAMRRTDAGDIDGFVALQAPDCVWRTPDGEVHGHEELRAWLGTWVAGFPDERRHALERVEQHGSTVIAEGVFHGVNAGALATPEGTLPPTGRTLAMPFAILVDIDVASRHATRVHLHHDRLGFLEQLGLLPAAEAAATA